ncbi:GNAT family N-acetyltransferase [Streptomyces sp. W1SF4]|uniref:GNAT family N-acetyltransferase n=1 Tax=Streptomyces sp. W1SF4 TaxID=2305220 RepID=UPI000F6FFDE6|nr:GNAT family N-acetyltransferase [Streptomyces sp. W1SF4]AZM90333.1 GNAT family N-acetyltransferase [Streptomyces sp. W1SF4]
MSQSTQFAVETLDGQAAAHAEAAFRSVYAEAFAEPPYEETEADVSAAFRRFRSQTRKSTFVGALATHDGEPIGMAYGYPLSPKTGWWDQLTEPVPEDMRREDGHRTFGLMELAVRAHWRRQGIARRLHDTLLANSNAERVLLNVRPDSEPAVAAYRSWGYRKVGDAQPWPGAPLHDVMLLPLRADQPERSPCPG